MTGNLVWQKNRLLIPRWRLFANTLCTGELASPKKPEDRKPKSVDFLGRIENWRTHPSLISAAEIVEAAIVEGYEDEALDAARRLVQIEKNAALLIRIQAHDLLKRHGISIEFPELPAARLMPLGARGSIRANLHDALAWLDLANFQTNRGHLDNAKRSMLVALQLAPENRFVLRSASRFFLHLGRPDIARDILLRSAGINSDPWLMSAEISISEILKKGPRTAKIGFRLIEDGMLRNRQTTELAGALATLEMNGNRKKMRRLFRHSMLAPTGNALAQAAWASPVVGIDLVPTGISIYGEHEAPAQQSYNEGKFDLALKNGKLWVDDEPFATRPFEFTASAAGVVEQFDVAIKYADLGLKRTPDSNRLLLAKSFALASSGNTKEASLILSRVDRKIEKGVFGYFASADEGLVAFREGRIEEARKLYHHAIRGFRFSGDAALVATAQSYLAREAFRAGDPEADELLKEAKENVEKVQKSKLAWHALNLALSDRGLGQVVKPAEPEKLIWSTPIFSGSIETDPQQGEIQVKKITNRKQ